MNQETTIYVVDGDQSARESMALVARSKGLQVRECESAEALLSAFQAGNQACLIVEAQLPGISGLELQQRLNGAGKLAPIVMVGANPDVRTAVRAMQQGAVTFLPKPCSTEELSAAIDTALERSSQHQSALQQMQGLRERFGQLSASEREVLSRVIEGQSNKRISTEMDLGLRTVELRRSNIMRKTGASNLSELIRLAIEVGFPGEVPAPAAEDRAGQSSEYPPAGVTRNH